MYQINHPLYRIVDGTIDPPQAELLPGFHVNSTISVPEAASYRVLPERPVWSFAGQSTYYYKFESPEQAAEFGFTVQPKETDE